MRLHADRSLQPVQHTLHDVHANAPAGNFRDLLGGREARTEDIVEDLRFAQARSFFRGHHSQLNRLGANLLCVDAAPIVGDFDDHLVSMVIGVEAHDPLRILAQLCGVLPRVQYRG